MTFWPPRKRDFCTDTITWFLVPTSTPCNRSWNVARPRWSNLQRERYGNCFCMALAELRIYTLLIHKQCFVLDAVAGTVT
jgi:hypothetical protein